MAMEDRLHVSIPDESWERVQTVSELFELIAGLQEASNADSLQSRGSKLK